MGGSSAGGQQAAMVGRLEDGTSQAECEHLPPAAEGGELQAGESMFIAFVFLPKDDPQAASLDPFNEGVLVLREARMPHRGRVLKGSPYIPLVQCN